VLLVLSKVAPTSIFWFHSSTETIKTKEKLTESHSTSKKLKLYQKSKERDVRWLLLRRERNETVKREVEGEERE
jgi:hypothetical protein